MTSSLSIPLTHMSSLPLSYVEKKTKNVCFQPHTTEEVKRRFVSQWKTSVNYNSFCINWHLISSTNKKKRRETLPGFGWRSSSSPPLPSARSPRKKLGRRREEPSGRAGAETSWCPDWGKKKSLSAWYYLANINRRELYAHTHTRT